MACCKIVSDVIDEISASVKMAATEKQWYVGEDGSLSVGEPAVGVTYHCALNAIIVSTKNPSLKVIDVTTGSLLQNSKLSGKNISRVQSFSSHTSFAY